ncbi:hypothetical protein FQN60_013975 [Etheostoma spectabile]|uniref:CCHC-type domain-containing protein n=1 Tax=Etheostoma spectabile TaxID=54343 RepID=A0A5J5CC00_9PERO|nr:hypothetical protein FQN60_002467 [Etheostoma spectabile]KAA8578643.1 hypothetical protein FQN60_013975 [Etheostoma spectabile]
MELLHLEGYKRHPPTPSQYHKRATPVVGKAPLRENQPTNTQRSSKVPICYLCGQEGHTKPICPRNPAKITQIDQTLVHRQFGPTNVVCTLETIPI